MAEGVDVTACSQGCFVRLDPAKLKSNDESGVKLLVATLGGSWGQTDLERSYDYFERAIYGAAQKADETHDSYIARHDVHFEEMIAQGTSLDQIRAYVLLRQSQLSSEDRKRIVVESGGKLEYSKVGPAIRLLGSRFSTDLQGQRTSQRTKVYDANVLEETNQDDSKPSSGEEFSGEELLGGYTLGTYCFHTASIPLPNFLSWECYRSGMGELCFQGC